MLETIGVFPGSFKLFHPGHLYLISKYIDKVDKLLLIISNKDRDFVNCDQAYEWAKLVLENYDDEGKLEIVISDMPSPVSYAFNYIKKNPGHYIWIQSTKDGEQGIIERLQKLYNEENLLVSISNIDMHKDPIYCKDELYSGTYIRELIKEKKYIDIINLFKNINFELDNDDELLSFLNKNFNNEKIPFNKHLNRIYEQDDLTFQDLINITNTFNNPVSYQEKIDGINMKISFKNGKFICARNKSEYKNFGEHSYSTNNNTIYNRVLNDLNNRIDVTDNNFYNFIINIFKEGKFWLNTDITDYEQPNVFLYNHNRNLYIHNILESDIEGNLYYTKNDFININEFITKINSIIDPEYKYSYILFYTRFLTFLPNTSTYDHINKFVNKLKQICNHKYDMTLKEHKLKVFKYILSSLDFSVMKISENELNNLYNRLMYNDTSFHLKNYNDEAKRFLTYIKDNHINIKHKINKDLDFLYMNFEYVILNNIEYKDKIKLYYIEKDLLNEISEILITGDQNDISKVTYNLERLKNNNMCINSYEGIIVPYKNYTFKLTGTFGPINQILGIRKFKKN